MQPSTLRTQGSENTPVKSPPTTTRMIMMGRTRTRKKFLILSVHLKRRKQGKLKKEVHWFSHMYSENSPTALSSLSTCSLAKFTALLNVYYALLASSVAVVLIV